MRPAFVAAAVIVLLSCSREPVAQSTAAANQPKPIRRVATANDVAESAGQPLRVGKDVTAPVLIDRVEPELPRRVSVAGPILLEAVIDREGRVQNVRILRDGTQPPLGPAYVKAIQKWRFRPGTHRGKPVDVVYNLSVNIHVR